MARVRLVGLSARRRRMLAAVALAVGLGAAAVLAVAGGLFEGRPAGIPDSPPGAASIAEVADYEPFAPSELGDEELLERARDGYAHPLYTIPPGGAVGSAARTARLRPLVEAAARRHDVEPETRSSCSRAPAGPTSPRAPTPRARWDSGRSFRGRPPACSGCGWTSPRRST